MNEINEKKIDISAFLIGKYIYLRPPNIEKDVLKGKWFSWFNDKNTTKFLLQGVFPNTIEKQLDFVESLKTDANRILLCIIDKATNEHIGVISINDIDLLNKTATISIVLGEKNRPKESGLEAIGLMKEYAFDRLNLNKLNGGQVVDLWKWVNKLELIGYRIEGLFEAMSVRDGKIHDVFHTGITAERFYKLREERNGNIFSDDVENLTSGMDFNNPTEKIRGFFKKMYEK